MTRGWWNAYDYCGGSGYSAWFGNNRAGPCPHCRPDEADRFSRQHARDTWGKAIIFPQTR